MIVVKFLTTQSQDVAVNTGVVFNPCCVTQLAKQKQTKCFFYSKCYFLIYFIYRIVLFCDASPSHTYKTSCVNFLNHSKQVSKHNITKFKFTRLKRLSPFCISNTGFFLSLVLPSWLEFQKEKPKQLQLISAASRLLVNNCMYVCTIVLLFIFVLNCISVFKNCVKFLALKL